MPLPRLLLLPAFATWLALAGTAAGAQPVQCPCWPGGPPLVAPSVCYQSPAGPLNAFAYLSPPATFLQVTGGWCRSNGTFRLVTPAEAQVCAQQLQCLCANPSPGAEVLCNGNDDDCNPTTPDEASGPCAANAAGICAEGTLTCQNGQDVCLPGLPHPLGEACGNALDEDCDGFVDDLDVCQTCFPNGLCNTGLSGPCGQGLTTCPNGLLGAPGCETQYQPVPEVLCNVIDDDCNAATPDSFDADGDGASSCLDCDDADPANHPGNTELCDGQDNDCNGQDDVLGFDGSETDDDGDGVSECQGDCNDGNPTIYPGAPDACDGIDQSCSGTADDDPLGSICPAPPNVAATVCNGAAGCGIAECSPGFQDSDGIYANGCEAPAICPCSPGMWTDGIGAPNLPPVTGTQVSAFKGPGFVSCRLEVPQGQTTFPWTYELVNNGNLCREWVAINLPMPFTVVSPPATPAEIDACQAVLEAAGCTFP